MLYPRFITSNILTALKDTPVIMLTGARQTGKTTLVRKIAEEHHPATYFTLDDLTRRGAAQSDPKGFLEQVSGPIIIDEIQLAPELLSAIKIEVDHNRKPGRFIITGSANVLTLPRVSESLAGRMEIFTLFPLSQGELISRQEGFIDWIFEEKLDIAKLKPVSSGNIWEQVVAGGYPEAIARTDVERRQAWFRDYTTTILQRDIRDLARINGITQMPRLLELLATRTATLLNVAEISRSIKMPQTSLKCYLALFEATYLIFQLPAWSGNIGKKILKTPKLFFVDSGLVAFLSGIDLDLIQQKPREAGQLFENFVLTELVKQAQWSKIRPHFFHFRSQTNQQVDFILEDRQRRWVGIEVKAAKTIRPNDFNGLRWLKNQMGTQFLRGIVIYCGSEIVPFGDNLLAMPVDKLWQSV